MRRVVHLAVAAALVVGACSSSEDDEVDASSSDPSGGSAAGGDATGVTDTEIRIGGVYDAAVFADAKAGAQARVDRLNADGGIEGRELVLVDMLDDGADPNLGTDAARRLVEQEQVFAVGPIVSPTFAGGDYLAEQGVPFFGWGISATFCDNEYAFDLVRCIDGTRSTTISSRAHVWAEAAGEDSLDGMTMAVIADDNDAGNAQLEPFAAVAESDGGEVVYSDAVLAPPPAVVGDYTPYATDILASADGGAPDIVHLLASPGNVIGMSSKLRELGYEGLIFNGVMYDPQAVAVASSMTTMLNNAPFEQTDIPAMQQTVDDLEAAGSSLSLGALTAYWATDHLIQVLEDVGPDLTREQFVEVLNDGFTFDGQGVFADLTYPEAHLEGIPSCGAAVNSNGSEYEVVVPYTCEDDLPNPAVEN